MIRHPEQRNEAISFFAFLSVVSCTIGALMVVLVCVTVVSFWGAEQVVELASTGSDPGLARIYVECRPEGLIVHPAETIIALDDLDDPVNWIDGPFGQCLAAVRARGSEGSVYFLVRRGGVAAFRKALGYTVAVGGGTTDAVERGEARFSIGQQLVEMPGSIRVKMSGEGDTPEEVSSP